MLRQFCSKSLTMLDTGLLKTSLVLTLGSLVGNVSFTSAPLATTVTLYGVLDSGLVERPVGYELKSAEFEHLLTLTYRPSISAFAVSPGSDSAG